MLEHTTMFLGSFISAAFAQDLKIIIPLPKELQEKEFAWLEKEKEKITNQIESLKKQLSNPNFIERAPKELVDKTKQNLTSLETTLTEISEKLKSP